MYKGPSSRDGHGIGSVLHIMSIALMDALDSNRILVEHPNSTYLAAEEPWCRGTRRTLDSCYFVPLTNTLTADELASAVRLDARTDQAAVAKMSGRVLLVDRGWTVGSKHRTSIPRRFRQRLATTGVPRRTAYYWWRGQAAAYLVRPNARTITELDLRYKAKNARRSTRAWLH